MDEAALDRYAEAAWVLRCERSAEAKERPPVTVPWKDRAPFLREIDKSVVSLVAAMAVKDAGLENTRRDAQLFALASVMPAVLDALRAAAADAKYEAQAQRFTAALEVLGGGEGQERSDDKEARNG